VARLAVTGVAGRWNVEFRWRRARFEVDRAVGRWVRAPVAVARSVCMTPVVVGAAVV
jgi:hypothetical protein